MRRGGLAAVAVLMASGSPALAQDDVLLGRWRTPAQNGVVAFERCGAALCARVVDAAALRANPDQRDVRNRDPALRHRRVRGLTVVRAVSGGPEVWRAGPLYDPDSGQGAATGTLTLIDADRLAVRGCVARMLCRTQTWTRAR
ncbi:DUF2147 domain-containing protein [Brevundimonas sp.]|uniref:DUF2147 domain-containing protein n=1 Tax=Brevundimonas sp. TaxID=1871086 RepID=UPI0028A0F3E5|nr:DUF2147 domain-containing protein [Brevundimonas sp.]